MKRKYFNYIIIFAVAFAVISEIVVYLGTRPIEIDYEPQVCDSSMEVGTHCLSESEHVIVGFDNTFLASSDEEEDYNWQEATELCESKGAGWKLPSRDQMELIYKERDVFESNFCHPIRRYCAYWTSTEASVDDGRDGSAYITKRGSHMEPKGGLWEVRCIKNSDIK